MKPSAGAVLWLPRQPCPGGHELQVPRALPAPEAVAVLDQRGRYHKEAGHRVPSACKLNVRGSDCSTAQCCSLEPMLLAHALLVCLLEGRCGKGRRERMGFTCTLFQFSSDKRSREHCSNLWFGLAASLRSHWMWFGSRGPGVGAGGLDAVLCSGTGLLWPPAGSSTALGHFFYSFANICLVSNLLGANPCLCAHIELLSCLKPRTLYLGTAWVSKYCLAIPVSIQNWLEFKPCLCVIEPSVCLMARVCLHPYISSIYIL